MVRLLCLAFMAVGVAASGTPSVTMYPQYNQALNVLVPQGTSKGGTVKYLDSFPKPTGAAECQSACIAHTERCWSFVYFPVSGESLPMKIRVTSTGEQLQANDLGDNLLSTRYQEDDAFSRYTVESVPGQDGAVRLRVVADGRLIGADSSSAWMLGTSMAAAGGDEDDSQHFVLAPATTSGTHQNLTSNFSDSPVKIQTKANGGYWKLDENFVSSNASIADATQFTISKTGGGGGECYAVLSPGFNPSFDTTAVSGVVHWGCRTDDDCSLNGKCDVGSGICRCRPAWKGDRCELLHLLPPTRGAGYRGVDNGHNTSSWGGAVLRGADGRYHMWAAEMTEHCGIGAWVQNSRVIHATSDTPGGAYKRTSIVWEVFSHEPEVVPLVRG